MDGESMELLRERLDQGFEDLHRRLDDNRDVQTERHQQNLAKLATLDADLRKVDAKVELTNGTVLVHTAELKNIALQGRPVTVGSLRLYAGIASGSVIGFVWLLHTLGLLK